MLSLIYPVSWLLDTSVRKGFSRGVSRKVIMGVGLLGPGLALVGIPHLPAGNTTLPVVLLILGGALNVGAFCVTETNAMDLSPNFAGILGAFGNFSASVTGIVGPLIVGHLVTDLVNYLS